MKFQPSLFFAVVSTAGVVSAYTPGVTPPRARTNRQSTTAPPKAVAVPLSEDSQKIGGPSSPSSSSSSSLPKEDQWVADLDYEGFGKEVSKLGKDLLKMNGQEDVEHLNKMVAWRNAAALIGVATMWMTPNPITILALSTWTYVSWTMVAHHTCHGGYNRVDAGKFNSRGFALGTVRKRVMDWLDWMMPEAWNIEHNRLHHYRLNEVSDPDLVQRNMDWIRSGNLPMAARYGVVAFFLPIWKWFYYAPNTYKELQVAKWKQQGKEFPADFNPKDSITIVSLFAEGKEKDALRQVCNPKEFFAKVLAPFFALRLLVMPAPLLAIPGVGPTLFAHAFINLILADLLTNIHGFITIVTNHAGEDLYTFDDAVKPKSPSFYVRQVVGSANYAYGDDLTDFSHGFLNYQIEHHVWPDLSMRQYQVAAPQLKAICDKYGVPYIQESVWERLRKTVDVMVGKATMRTFPTTYEPIKDKVDNVTWKSTNGAIDED